MRFRLLVLGHGGGDVGDYFTDISNSFSPTFTEYQTLPLLQKLWMFDKSEQDLGLVSSPQTLGGHPDDGGRLSYGAAVDHGLVLAGDCGGVVEHQDLPLELVGALRLQGRADHHHPLPDLRPLYFLQGETGSLAALHFRHRHSLTVY